jgi:hypothetical protein
MTDSVTFNARALFAMAPDRIYRVEVRNGCLYFLRIGGQFDLDRGTITPGQLPAVMILAAGEAVFRKHKREELVARDPTKDPEELLGIHPHNFRLLPSEIKRVTFHPKKWLLSLVRPHFGRLVIEQPDGTSQEYHLERLADLQAAFDHLPALLGDKVDKRIRWDERKKGFVKDT